MESFIFPSESGFLPSSVLLSVELDLFTQVILYQLYTVAAPCDFD